MPPLRASPSDIPLSRWSAIRLFAMDVDGILTDGTVRISSDGVETKSFSILDGLGLVRLREHGVRRGEAERAIEQREGRGRPCQRHPSRARR